jgi:hypothetical protein
MSPGAASPGIVSAGRCIVCVFGRGVAPVIGFGFVAVDFAVGPGACSCASPVSGGRSDGAAGAGAAWGTAGAGAGAGCGAGGAACGCIDAGIIVCIVAITALGSAAPQEPQ